MQRFDCSGCGECCRGRFAIVATAADRARIEKQAWTDADLALRGKPLFTRHGQDFQLAHGVDGACVFLDRDNRCRIHAKFGESAKPVGCRLYPFRLIPLGSQARVDVRFDCPSIAANQGRALPAHQAGLSALLKLMSPGGATADASFRFNQTTALTWTQLGRVTDAFDRILLDVSLDITRRVCACADLNALLSEMHLDTIGDDDLDELLDTLTGDVQAAAADDPSPRAAPQPLDAACFRYLLTLYGRIDEAGASARPFTRLATSLAMLAASGSVPALRRDFPSVAFETLEASTGAPAGEAALAFERYLHVHLTSMGFFGRAFYGRSYTQGLSALLLVYPLACWMARLYAAGGETAPVRASVERALMVVDHQHGVTPLLDTPSGRFITSKLTEPRVLRGLVAWYGS